jgi:hypothetical protein
LEIGGDSDASVTAEELGFREIYFQFFYMLDTRNFLAFELQDEAFIQQGYHVTFDSSHTYSSSTKIAPMPSKSMRPTII